MTGAFLARIDPDKKKILQIRASFGGMAPITKLALHTTKGFEGRKWDEALLEEMTNRLVEEFKLPPEVS